VPIIPTLNGTIDPLKTELQAADFYGLYCIEKIPLNGRIQNSDSFK
jgi:hypothetical protein